MAALVFSKRKKYTIEAVSELTFILIYLIIRFGWSLFSVGRVGTQYKNRFFCKPHCENIIIRISIYLSKHRLTIIIFYLGLPSNPGGSGVSAILPNTQTFIKISLVAISGVLCGPNTTCISVSFVRDYLNYRNMRSYWPRSSVGRAAEDLIWRSWAQAPPRSSFLRPVGTPKFPVKRVITLGNLVYRQYCLLSAPKHS